MVIITITDNIIVRNKLQHIAVSEDAQSSMAVYIDYENLALGTGTRRRNGKQNPGPVPDVQRILERLVDKGRIVAKRAYCDWQRFPTAVHSLHALGVELIEVPDRQHSGKNSADIHLSVDAIEMCLTKEHIDTFAILSGDSDFSPLIAKLKEFGCRVIGVGMQEATSPLLVENCDEFIYYEDIVTGAGMPDFVGKVPKDKHACYQLLLETVDALQREGSAPAQASLVKDTMRRKRPQFSERSYGYRSFTTLLHEAAGLKLITIRDDERSGTVVVDGFCE